MDELRDGVFVFLGHPCPFAMPCTPRSFWTHRRFAAVATLATLAAVVAGCSRRPPETRPPAPTTPGSPATQPSTVPGAATPIPAAGLRGFVYAAGTHRYTLSTEAILDYRPDSVAPGYGDTVATTALVTYSIAEGGGGSRVQISGTVDSFALSKVLGSAFALPSATGAPAAPGTPGGPLLFRGTLELTGSRRLDLPPPSGSCDSPDDALLVAVREVIAPPPPSLDAGAAWQDTVDYSLCRAGIPAATRLVRSFVVEGPATLDTLPTPAIRVRRTSTLTMTGGAELRGQAVTLSGSGTGTADLYFDPAAGRFLGANADNSATITVSGGAHVRSFTQRGKVVVRERP